MLLPGDWFPNLGECIGGGVDGLVYLTKSGTEVVKFSHDPYNVQLLAELVANQPVHFVKVLDFGIGRNDTHFVVMERLQPLTADEAKVLNSIVSHEDANKVKSFEPEQLNDILDDLAIGLDFDKGEVIALYNAAMSSGFVHADMHERNIMKTNDGQFKLIDLDRLYRKDFQ